MRVNQMNMTEYLNSGHRRCSCDNVNLVVKSYEYKTEKLYSQNAIKNLMLSATLGIRYNKPVKRWKAVCTQCDKYYLFGDTKRELLQKLNKCGIPFTIKTKTINE